MDNNLHRIWLIALMACFGQAAAQEATETPAPASDPEGALDAALPVEAPPRYQVEVIVFAHTDSGANQEDFAHGATNPEGPLALLPRFDPDMPILASQPGRLNQIDPGRIRLEQIDPGQRNSRHVDPEIVAVGENSGADNEGTDEEGEAAVFTFQPLQPEAFQLRNTAEALERLGAYEVLGHVAWVQNGLERDSATPMDLQTLGVSSPTGTVQLYLGRFLHIAVDLQYSPPGAATLRTDAFGLQTFSVMPTYHLQTERNAIRSGELHYIDHPMFGLLVLVTPAEDMEEANDDDTSVLEPAA